jgi:hypothetical protein
LSKANQTNEQLQQTIEAIKADFYWFCSVNLRITNKAFQVVPFEPKPVQRILIDYVIECLATGQPIRVIILKARQQGISTAVEAIIYWWTSTHSSVKAKIVSHESSSSDHLFSMFRTYHGNSNLLFKPQTKYDTKSSMWFESIDSNIDVATARNISTGRSQTIGWLHASEAAFWPRGEELLAGMMQAVPLLPNTAIFIESTANGVGDFFYRLWQASKEGGSPFKIMFFGWFEDPEYQLPPPKQMHLTDEEKEWKEMYNLTNAQLAWYRYKTLENKATPGKLQQEYPFNDQEAFLASGRPRFDMKSLLKMEKACKPAKEYELIRKNAHKIEAKSISNMPLKIWTMPKDGEKYVIGADVAEGIGQDYSVATVIDTKTSTVVARWRGDAEPFEFGEVIYTLGKFYNDALVGVEVNNHGLTTIQRLRDMRYSNMYRREKGLDERFEEFTSRLGWRTDSTTKPLMIDALAEAIVNGHITDHDSAFVHEAMAFVVTDRGRTEAQSGSNDDIVISTAIAMQLFDWKPVTSYRKEVKTYLPKKYGGYSATKKRLQSLQQK